MTKTWEVMLPITGVLLTTVDMPDDAKERDAIEAALESELNADMIETWEAHKQIVRGNVCHAERNTAVAYQVDE